MDTRCALRRWRIEWRFINPAPSTTVGALVILKNYFLHTLTINLCPRASFYFRYCSADKLNYTLGDFRERLSRRCLCRVPPRALPNFLITFQFTACTTSSHFRSGLIKLYLIKVASHHWSYANAVLLVWCSDACILISDFEIREKLCRRLRGNQNFN